jgi:hypothetical protein
VISSYVDGNVGKQDEIELANKSSRLQINAECGPDGKYLEYPKEVSKERLVYLNDVVEMFATLSNKNKSHIRVNNTDKLIAKDGVWVDIEKQERSKEPPRLDKAKPKLPSG